MPKANPVELYCSHETFAEKGEAFSVLLANAAKALPAEGCAPAGAENQGAGHEC